MSQLFDVQARRQQRRDGVLVRDESRLARTATLDEATRGGRALAADWFTVWIYRVEGTDGFRPVYHPLRTLRPDPADEQRAPGCAARTARGMA